ncbi:TPA: phosphoadenylyl-sulfate reductase, partial [Candidatus Poribacteria bacterium]|nr:phosphoadenylyl-sulfate reductase [Candidatus Poribacteria bacterium]
MEVEKVAAQMEDRSPQEVLEWAIERFKGKIALANSFGAEDVVLTDMIVKIDPSVRIFTLDTGRLPQETYDVWDR